ncbi:MAG: hypothetical protein ACRCT1_03415 [Microcoleaceae cyanobacterium]|jgi:hypothetical protein
MKNFSTLAVLLSTTTIAGSLVLGSMTKAHACYLDNPSVNQTSTTKHWAAKGSDKMNPWAKTGAIALFSVGGLFSLGILYKGYRGSKEAEIALAGMMEKVDVVQTEDVEPSRSRALITSQNSHQHPEAPGGKLDLSGDRHSKIVEKEVFVSK